MEGSSKGARGAEGLAPWVCGPLLALAVMLVALADLPGAECGESGSGGSARETVVVTVTGLASLVTVAAACWRLVALRRRGRLRMSLKPVLAAAAGIVLLLVLVATTEPRQLPSLLFGAVAVGLLLTVLTMLALMFGWARSRSVEDAGLFVPFYLLGAGLLCFPAITGVALAVNDGVLC